MTQPQARVARERDYSLLLRAAPARNNSRELATARLVDEFWEALSPQGVSWIGFYHGPGQKIDDGRTVQSTEMLLGPCRNKPACSPIGLHGVCGRGWRERRSIVVRHVAVLGPDYVACDPRDKSEVVVPLFDPAGECWGVLDADSFDVGAFNESDAHRLHELCSRAGLTHGAPPPIVVV